MDDWVDYLEGEQDNPNGLLLEILSSGYESWDYVAAVEGPDDALFYYDFLNNCLGGKEIRFLPCGGKHRLLDFKLISESYDWVNPPIFLYLCDKDFDDYLRISRVGVWSTDPYSIESYISNRAFVKYVVKKYASPSLTTAEISAFMARFDHNHTEMLRHLRGFAAFMCEVRSNSEHPCFDDFGIAELFDLGGTGPVKKSARVERAIEKLNLQRPLSKERLASRARTFKMSEVAKWLRGKLALQVLRKAFDFAQRSSPQHVRDKLPGSSYFGSDGLKNAFAFVGPIPSLSLYCLSAK